MDPNLQEHREIFFVKVLPRKFQEEVSLEACWELLQVDKEEKTFLVERVVVEKAVGCENIWMSKYFDEAAMEGVT